MAGGSTQQGFPDDYTRWGADGKELSDSARYRLVGNAVATPVVLWIARRLQAVFVSAEGGVVRPKEEKDYVPEI